MAQTETERNGVTLFFHHFFYKITNFLVRQFLGAAVSLAYFWRDSIPFVLFGVCACVCWNQLKFEVYFFLRKKNLKTKQISIISFACAHSTHWLAQILVQHIIIDLIMQKRGKVGRKKIIIILQNVISQTILLF